jgi:pimeloyl-ACP methyl ester carboxylesterase
MFNQNFLIMKRLFSIPAIGLLFALLLANRLSQAQNYFTAEVKGKGNPLILIHGFSCSGEVWKEVVEHYQKDYECHILTLAGFGGVSPNLNDHFLESVKDDIIQYAQTKKLKKPVLIGHSMGGYLSFWAAASAPDVFEKIIAVDGLPFFPALQMPGATAETSRPVAENMKNMFSTQTPEQARAGQKMYLPSMITDPAKINLVAEIASRCDPKTLGQVMYEMYTTDLRDSVAKIGCPVLVLGAWIAYKNYGVTRESSLNSYKDQIKTIKNCKIELSDTAKHFIFFDDPQWFYEKVDSFLKD